ncbi:unnamed protein product [Dicrocoelium dendriticum]|nr:unnamed protein product [Dicrocoelium dendriticum]
MLPAQHKPCLMSTSPSPSVAPLNPYKDPPTLRQPTTKKPQVKRDHRTPPMSSQLSVPGRKYHAEPLAPQHAPHYPFAPSPRPAIPRVKRSKPSLKPRPLPPIPLNHHTITPPDQSPHPRDVQTNANTETSPSFLPRPPPICPHHHSLPPIRPCSHPPRPGQSRFLYRSVYPRNYMHNKRGHETRQGNDATTGKVQVPEYLTRKLQGKRRTDETI